MDLNRDIHNQLNQFGLALAFVFASAFMINCGALADSENSDEASQVLSEQNETSNPYNDNAGLNGQNQEEQSSSQSNSDEEPSSTESNGNENLVAIGDAKVSSTITNFSTNNIIAPTTTVSTLDAFIDKSVAGIPGYNPPQANGGNPNDRAGYLWKGFHHEWLRTVVGFHVPHRISKLHSFIDTENHSYANGNYSSNAKFHMAQNTGVDGNFMDPVGYYGAIYNPNISVKKGTVNLNWTDDGDGGTYPKAKSKLVQTVTVALNNEAMGYGNLHNYISVLRGIEMDIQCVGSNCNSNGMWPYKYYISLRGCYKSGTNLKCTLTVEINRAWTPAKGGLQPFETKPFDDKLNFDLKIHYTVIGGDNGNFRYTLDSEFNRTGSIRDNAKTGTRYLNGTSGYNQGTSALTAIGFELSKPANKSAKKYNQLGRYIGELNYRVKDAAYYSSTGQLAYNYTLQTWSPDTVHVSDVKYYMQAALLQFNSSGEVHKQKSVVGEICNNSTDNAPLFSKWKKCGTGDKGPEQSQDVKTVSIY